MSDSEKATLDIKEKLVLRLVFPEPFSELTEF
jgi:hypothetical protein